MRKPDRRCFTIFEHTEKTCATRLYQRASFQSTCQSCLVSVFQFAADRNAACNARDLDPKRLEQLGKVKHCGFALDRRVQSEDDFLGGTFAIGAESCQQFLDFKVVGTYAIERRNNAMQDMINPVVLIRFFKCNHIAGRFNYANQVMIALRTGANRAGILMHIGNILADATIKKFRDYFR
jgi:hypothetical protein